MSIKRFLTMLIALSMLLAACSVEPAVPESTLAPTPGDEASVPATAVVVEEATAAPQATTASTAVPVPPPPPTADAGTAVPTAASQPSAAGPPVLLTGSFTYTNDIITTYYVEHMVALVDMYGFVTRDEEWELPVDSQVLGYLDLDPQNQQGQFNLDLPAQPRGTAVDVDNNGEQNTGVQVFALAYWPNLVGGPYSDAFDPSFGWPSYLASTKNDSENDDEVIGGKLVVWAPDDQQQFPTGYGPDGLLFTQDDPAGPLAAGYSVIDLDQQPFAITRNGEEKLTLYEPDDAAIKDFSNLSYTEAYQQMFARVRAEYAFNGIQGKEPNWDQLNQDLLPRVQDAELKQDPLAFYLAIRDFTFAFNDGHVGLNGGQYGQQVFLEAASSGYGFAARKLDDGSYIAVYVTQDGPAAKAGIQVGATLTEFDGKPIDQAVSEVQPLAGPFSTDFAREYQQARYLTRALDGAQASVTFTNPNGQPQTAQLTAVPERESFSFTSTARGFDPTALPVEYRILDAGVGYVKINSNYDDLNLIVRLFERALTIFEQNQLPGVIIDMRQNSGGAPLDLAGYLTNQEIPLAQLEYYSDATKQFEPEGVPGKVSPKPQQFQFDKIVLLVDQSCYSACEIESYGFSQVPGMVVIGQYPTAGVEAEVARGQFLLPEGMAMQVPTGRFILPDGSIFLEGQGVQPTIRVPITRDTVLAQDDVVLQRALQEFGGR